MASGESGPEKCRQTVFKLRLPHAALFADPEKIGPFTFLPNSGLVLSVYQHKITLHPSGKRCYTSAHYKGVCPAGHIPKDTESINLQSDFTSRVYLRY